MVFLRHSRGLRNECSQTFFFFFVFFFAGGEGQRPTLPVPCSSLLLDVADQPIATPLRRWRSELALEHHRPPPTPSSASSTSSSSSLSLSSSSSSSHAAVFGLLPLLSRRSSFVFARLSGSTVLGLLALGPLCALRAPCSPCVPFVRTSVPHGASWGPLFPPRPMKWKSNFFHGSCFSKWVNSMCS